MPKLLCGLSMAALVVEVVAPTAFLLHLVLLMQATTHSSRLQQTLSVSFVGIAGSEC